MNKSRRIRQSMSRPHNNTQNPKQKNDSAINKGSEQKFRIPLFAI